MAEEEQNEEQAAASKPGPKSKSKEATKKVPTMAKGKAKTGPKGIVAYGDHVTPDHFRGGKKEMDRLREKGDIVDMDAKE